MKDHDEDVKRGREIGQLFPPPTAPLAVAETIYSGEYRTHSGMRTLVSWRGGWMQWHGTHWSEVDTAELRSRIYSILGTAEYQHETKDGPELRSWHPDKRKVANVLEALAAVGHLSGEIDPPAWIGLHSAAENISAQMISCRNGLLDVATRKLADHTPALFNVVSVPFDYDDHATEPTAWLDFLESVWGDDEDSIKLVQEFFGYVLSGRLDMQKLLMLIGPTRSGKGTIARVLTDLVGRGHVAGPTLASLGTNFGLSPLLGKPLAIIADARLGNIPSHTVVERLLSITGEDMLTVDRKFREPWSGKLPTRFVILSNELPRFRDSSAAIANRLLIVQMTNSFLGREDRTLDARLRDEYPAILSWALEGLDRLSRAGSFTVPESATDAANLMMDLASPVSAFVRDRCVRDPQQSVLRDDLYDAWKTWAEDNGHKAGAKSTFGRDLRAVVPEVKDSQPRINGVQVRQYDGIGLTPMHQSYTGNGYSDVSRVSGTEAPCQDSATDTGDPVSPERDRDPSSTDTGDTGTSSLPAHHDRNGSTFRPPTGPGRCDECGCHIEKQGHRAECSSKHKETA